MCSIRTNSHLHGRIFAPGVASQRVNRFAIWDIRKNISIPCMVYQLSKYGLFLLSLCNLSTAAAQSWDWVPKDQLSEEQQSTLGRYCTGRFVDPWVQPQDKNTHLTADIIYRDDKGEIYMQGMAELQQPELTLKADKIQGAPNSHYLAEGNVEMRQAGQLILSDRSYLAEQGNQTDTSFENAQFIQHNSGMRGEAGKISKDQYGVVFIQEGFYTTCEPNSSGWELYGSSIELDSNSGFGTATHVQLRIDGNPIFYFPWIRFPIDNQRHTGFLFPTFGWSESVGARLSAPFYLNLAPNYDATLTPHFIEYDGEGLDVELRHLSPFGTTVYEHGTFMHERDGEQGARKLTSTQKFTSQIEAGLLIEESLTNGDFPRKTDITLGEKDNYERNAYLSFTEGTFTAKATVKRFQTPIRKIEETEINDEGEEEVVSTTIIDQPYEWDPRFETSWQYTNDWMDYNPSFEYTEFYDPDETLVYGERQALTQDFSLPLENSWGKFAPGVIQQYRRYHLTYPESEENDDLDEAIEPANTELEHYSWYVDAGVVLERSFLIDNTVWRQTLEPRLMYLNSPELNQDSIPNFDTAEAEITYDQAFNHQRFTGSDRIGDTEQYSIGLESRIYDNDNHERWTFKIGQIFYVQDRKIDPTNDYDEESIDEDPRSSLLSSINYRDSDLLSISSIFNYDTDEDLIDLAQASLKLYPENGIRVKASFIYTSDKETRGVDSRQSELGAILPLGQNWHFLYQQNYDWVEKQETKKVAGLGFENCCAKATFSYQRWLDSDSDTFDEGLFFHFILRSLSGVGEVNSESSIANDYWNDGDVGYKNE